jgi:hypothetical protein
MEAEFVFPCHGGKKEIGKVYRGIQYIHTVFH